MRVLILAAMLVGASSLCSLSAQEQGKLKVEVPQTVAPGRADQNSEPPLDQRAGRDPSRAADREMGPDWRMRRGEGGRMGRDDREMGSEGRMRRGDGDRMGREDREMGPGPRVQRDRDTGRDGDGDRGQYTERDNRGSDYADRDKDNRGTIDEQQPRRRVKICVEYDNGDEYCRYRR